VSVKIYQLLILLSARKLSDENHGFEQSELLMGQIPMADPF